MSEIEAVIKRLMKYCGRANKEVTQSIERRKLVMDIEMVYSGLIEIMEQRDAAFQTPNLESWRKVMNKPFKALRDKMSPESQQRAATMTRELLRDELIGFGKSASKTADWIVDTYLPGAHVGTRISLENAIAECILDRVEELEQQRDAALKLADKYLALSWTPYINPGIELRAIFEPKEGK